MKLQIDPARMTLRDMEDMEAVTGQPIGAFLERFQGRRGEEVSLADFPAKMITAMVWVFGRKEEPGFTLDEARDLALTELDIAVPPAQAGGAARGSNGSRSSRGSTASRRRNSGV